MSVNKRECLSIREKFEIIRELERGEKNIEVCKDINLSSSTVSAILQSMDMGIIKSFKGYFRRFLVLQMIDRRERGLHDTVSLLDTICLIKYEWDTYACNGDNLFPEIWFIMRIFRW
jgi:hypothetical protein